MSSSYMKLLDTIRDAFGRVVYSHKTHEKQIEILHIQQNWYKWIHFIVIALIATGIVSVLITNAKSLLIATAILSFLSLFLTLYGLGFKPEEAIIEHRRTVDQLWIIRERFLNLISDMESRRLSDDDAAILRDQLAIELGKVYENAPDTTPMAYKKARNALQISGEMNLSDKEINQFLPRSLRKS